MNQNKIIKIICAAIIIGILLLGVLHHYNMNKLNATLINTELIDKSGMCFITGTICTEKKNINGSITADVTLKNGTNIGNILLTKGELKNNTKIMAPLSPMDYDISKNEIQGYKFEIMEGTL